MMVVVVVLLLQLLWLLLLLLVRGAATPSYTLPQTAREASNEDALWSRQALPLLLLGRSTLDGGGGGGHAGAPAPAPAPALPPP